MTKEGKNRKKIWTKTFEDFSIFENVSLRDVLDCQRCLFSTCCQPAACVRFFYLKFHVFPRRYENTREKNVQKLHCFECVRFASTFLVFHSCYLSLCPFWLFLFFWEGGREGGGFIRSEARFLILLAIVFVIVAAAFSLHFLCFSLPSRRFHFSKAIFLLCILFFITGICIIKYSFPVTLYDTRDLEKCVCIHGTFLFAQRLRAIMLCILYTYTHLLHDTFQIVSEWAKQTTKWINEKEDERERQRAAQRSAAQEYMHKRKTNTNRTKKINLKWGRHTPKIY